MTTPLNSKPISIDFFLPGTPEETIKQIQSTSTPEPVPPAATGPAVLPAGMAAADDPDRLLESLIRRSAAPGTADSIVADALRERHNVHVKQVRMIEMEARRQRREKREKK